MQMRNLAILPILLLSLAACEGVNYEKGKSLADIPSNINTIGLRDVYMADSTVGDILMPGTSDMMGGVDPKKAVTLSQNDQEVMAMTKANIMSQISNFGYKVVEGNAKSDIWVKFFVMYQPELGPLSGRSVYVKSQVYDTSGTPIFHATTVEKNAFGLLGAVAGANRDEMVSDATRRVVVQTIEEMRQGKMENRPVADATSAVEMTQ